MRDDFLGRDWADHHHYLSAAIHKLICTVSRSMAYLNAYEFDAPWRAPRIRKQPSRCD